MTTGTDSPPRAEAFDVTGDLPTGTTMLEASAGTGKTYTIAALATRYVAEGRAELGDLLLVTFGRAATSELRERVRERLSGVHRALAAPSSRDAVDPLIAHLAAVDDTELGLRRSRLARAVAEFDAATIDTTHGFCQKMLTMLGVLADRDGDATMVGEDIADLVTEVVDDVYLRRYAASDRPALTPAEAERVARAAVGDRMADLEPSAAQQDSLHGHRAGFAAEVVAEVARRKRERRLLDYDDLLLLLRGALSDPVLGDVAAGRLRERYRVVMVDEFQDTDPVQWQILRAAFHGHSTLVLIGDPKQAVYTFRGGDVVTYLSARDEARRTATLERNWRSDPALLRSLELLLGGAALGDDRIVVHPVVAGVGGDLRDRDAEPAPRLDGAGAALRVRQVRRSAFGLRGTRAPRVGVARDLVGRDVAAEVVRTLDGARVREGDLWRSVLPGDIAVLTRRNQDALAVQAELASAGVPAVVSGLASVFGTQAARQWATLLEALADPGHSGRTAAAALSVFVGWDATRLAAASEPDRDEVSDTVRAWAQLLAGRGVGALVEVMSAAGLARRTLAAPGGERLLTDLRHVGEVLHHVAVTERLGTAGLAAWLHRRIAEAGGDYAEERSRRLETDTDAVQVLTVHASKGLEFPIVLVPFCWDRWEPDEIGELRFHDDQGRRILHVGGSTDPHHVHARRRHLAAERGEDLRLLYVALTRARSQVVVWWAPSTISAAGPLTRLLLGDYPAGAQPPDQVVLGDDDEIEAVLTGRLAAAGPDAVVEGVHAEPDPGRYHRAPTPPAALEAATARGEVDQTWRRLSYSALTAQAHAATLGHLEPEVARPLDEPDGAGAPGDELSAGSTGNGGTPTPVPLGDLPAGAAFGTLVHEVLERFDPRGHNPGEQTVEAVGALAREAAGGQLTASELGLLATGLDEALGTPLGPLADDLPLRGFALHDRLSEVEFELPLGGGDEPAGRRPVHLGDLASALRRHLHEGDALAGYADRLDALAADDPLNPGGGPVLRGYLTGSIDAVLRVGGPEAPRYLVVDYKTNRLAPPGEPLTKHHYRPQALSAEMYQAHYPLQLILYLVALHRFLRWRQPGYDPDRHLGGGLYLFLRGMCSPTEPDGVFAWRPPSALVVELSALLDGSRT